jgi:pimeloyl-ACP methyl ester carboxylesterase
MKRFLRISLSILTVIAAFLLMFGCSSVQRKLLYFPSHIDLNSELSPWIHEDHIIGFTREVPAPKNIWLMLHGNGGQAEHRASVLPFFSKEDSVFILEYPGYGVRVGRPSMQSINEAARKAYEILRERFPSTPLCVIGESLGSGPASILATLPHPPDKLVLIVPYDELAKVAAEHFPFLPVRLLLHDNWNNVEALANYHGPLEIFAATFDDVIPIAHAKALAASKPQTIFHEFPGGHNDWTHNERVQFRYP